jgi:hypothetical protein
MGCPENWAGARLRIVKFGIGRNKIEGSLILFIILV